MTHPLAIARRFSRRLMPVVGLLFLALLVVGGAHHHADGGNHVCAVCSVGHSPAVGPQVTAPAAVPTELSRRVIAASPVAPRSPRTETASSRAPPLA